MMSVYTVFIKANVEKYVVYDIFPFNQESEFTKSSHTNVHLQLVSKALQTHP